MVCNSVAPGHQAQGESNTGPSREEEHTQTQQQCEEGREQCVVVPLMEVEQAPPALNSAVQHGENTDKCGELTRRQWTPLLQHQMSDLYGLSPGQRQALRPPEALTKQRAPPLESGSV